MSVVGFSLSSESKICVKYTVLKNGPSAKIVVVKMWPFTYLEAGPTAQKSNGNPVAGWQLWKKSCMGGGWGCVTMKFITLIDTTLPLPQPSY